MARELRPLAMPDEVAANDAIRRQIASKQAEWWQYLSERHAELMSAWKTDEPRYRAAAAKCREALRGHPGVARAADIAEEALRTRRRVERRAPPPKSSGGSS